MLALQTRAQISSTIPNKLLKVLEPEEARAGKFCPKQVALLLSGPSSQAAFANILTAGWGAVIVRERPDFETEHALIHSLAEPEVVRPGDVIRRGAADIIRVKYRRGANSNSLFVTERCNNRCLMCSQPPRDVDNDAILAENLALIPLIDESLSDLGVTGGEPTLLGDGLVEILSACKASLPSTRLHVLTNGRRMADADYVAKLGSVKHPSITWAVPLYADVATLHDYVVQASGAFEETLEGLYNLASRGQAVEIRFVVNARTIGRLAQFAQFVWRTLPFVAHVAIMGLEPMGFARSNRELLWIDPADCWRELEASVLHLAACGMAVSLYNFPQCALPASLRGFARKSISDWKHTFADQCAGCVAENECCGFFVSAGDGWTSRLIRPFLKWGEGNEALVG